MPTLAQAQGRGSQRPPSPWLVPGGQWKRPPPLRATGEGNCQKACCPPGLQVLLPRLTALLEQSADTCDAGKA